MSEILKMAENICKKRQELLEEIRKEEESEKEQIQKKIEDYVKKILNIFETSNNKEGLFGILILDCTGHDLQCFRRANKKSKTGFIYKSDDMQVGKEERKLVEDAISSFNNLDIKNEYFELIVSYFEENLSEYFILERISSACIHIKPKELSNCE